MTTANISVTVTDSDGASASAIITVVNTAGGIIRPTKANCGPAAIGITTFMDWGNLNNVLGTGDYSSWPVDAQGYHLIQGMKMSGTNSNLNFQSAKWKLRGCVFDCINPAQWTLNLLTGADDCIIEYCDLISADGGMDVLVPQSGGQDTPIRVAGGKRGEIRFNRIAHFSTAIKEAYDNFWIHDNLIWNPRDPGVAPTNDHTDGVMAHGYLGLRLINNVIENPHGQTDCFADFADGSSYQLINNLMCGSNYTCYFGKSKGSVITGQRFTNKFFPNCGSLGPMNSDPRTNGSTGLIYGDNWLTDASGNILISPI